MGQSVNTKAIYGWHIGYSDNVEMVDDYHELNDDQFKAVKIDNAHWSDEYEVFVALTEKTAHELEPIKLSEILEIQLKFNQDDIDSDFRLINSLVDWKDKLKEPPQWYFVGEYY